MFQTSACGIKPCCMQDICQRLRIHWKLQRESAHLQNEDEKRYLCKMNMIRSRLRARSDVFLAKSYLIE